MPRFQVTSPGGSQLDPIDLADLPMQVGRSEESDLRLDDSSVSRVHALVTKAQDRIWLEDHESLNGIWVNGKRLTRRMELKNHDRIMIGDFELVYQA